MTTSKSSDSRVRMRCNTVRDQGESLIVSLNAISDMDNSQTNKSFWSSVPSGALTLTITNQDSRPYFKEGEEYYLDITKAKVPSMTR